jgi:hypothetical protein
MLRGTLAVLTPFPTASSLVGHIHGMRYANGSGEISDRIFRALRDALDEPGGIVEILILLALVPALHATVSSTARSHPMLDREDIGQQAIAIIMTLAHRADWRRRETHLAYALARELRRSVFHWAQEEMRSISESHNDSKPERSVSAADLFERDVELKHFLHRSLRSGALDDDDLGLLIDFKLEGGMGDRRNGPVTNAIRQRMKRLLSKMRRHAQTGTAKRRG